MKVKTSEDNYSMNDSNFGILLEDKIYNIFGLKFPITIKAARVINDDNTEDTVGNGEIELDIEGRIVEEELYNNLPSNPDISKNIPDSATLEETYKIYEERMKLYKENTIFYKRNSNLGRLSDLSRIPQLETDLDTKTWSI